MKDYLLYNLSSPTIRSTIKIIDTGEKIKIDGYDRGIMLKGIFSGTGYEYSMTVSKKEIASKLRINYIDFDDLMNQVFSSFQNDPKCFSNIKTFFEGRNISFDYFSWRYSS